MSDTRRIRVLCTESDGAMAYHLGGGHVAVTNKTFDLADQASIVAFVNWLEGEPNRGYFHRSVLGVEVLPKETP
jgi:hypothetical protein